MNEELKCDICGAGPFKSQSGLSGHKQIMHGVHTKTIKTQPDEIKNRLKIIESQIVVLSVAIDNMFEALLTVNLDDKGEVKFLEKFHPIDIVQSAINRVKKEIYDKK